MTRSDNVLVPHWAFLPPPPATFSALRVRIYRPLRQVGCLTHRIRIEQLGGGRALLREVHQQGHQCIEEHWWQEDAAPAELVPRGAEPGQVTRTIRVGAGSRGSLAALSAAGPGHLNEIRPVDVLLVALDTVLAADARQVISVAARFNSPMPRTSVGWTVRVGGGSEGRLRLAVEADRGGQALEAAVWFGCGPRARRRTEVAQDLPVAHARTKPNYPTHL